MKNCISFLRRVLAHVTPVPILVGALQHVRLGIVAYERVHDCQVLHSGDHRLSLSAASGVAMLLGTFLCQDFDYLFSLEGGLLDIMFSVGQLGLERSDRVDGRFGLVPPCQHLFVSVLEHAALFGRLLVARHRDRPTHQ